jgi:anti-sigma factor RsiW
VKASTPARLARLPSVATTLGLGGGPLGGLFSPVTPETAESVVERAWEELLEVEQHG